MRRCCINMGVAEKADSHLSQRNAACDHEPKRKTTIRVLRFTVDARPARQGLSPYDRFMRHDIGDKRIADKVLLSRAPQQFIDHGIIEISDFDATRRAYGIQRFSCHSDYVGGFRFRCVHE